MTQRHEVSKCFWNNGTDRLARHRVATNLQFAKNKIKKEKSVSVNHSKLNTIEQGMPVYALSYFPQIFLFDLRSLWTL